MEAQSASETGLADHILSSSDVQGAAKMALVIAPGRILVMPAPGTRGSGRAVSTERQLQRAIASWPEARAELEAAFAGLAGVAA